MRYRSFDTILWKLWIPFVLGNSTIWNSMFNCSRRTQINDFEFLSHFIFHRSFDYFRYPIIVLRIQGKYKKHFTIYIILFLHWNWRRMHYFLIAYNIVNQVSDRYTNRAGIRFLLLILWLCGTLQLTDMTHCFFLATTCRHFIFSLLTNKTYSSPQVYAFKALVIIYCNLYESKCIDFYSFNF